MPLQFDPFGNLPLGVHTLRLDEVLAIFGTGSARRQWLAARLQALLTIARDSGLVRRVFIWGSFVTSKPNPNDLDLLLVMKPGLQDEELHGPITDLLNHEQARLRFSADLLWVREDIGQQTLRLILDTYQVDRDKRRRGIVEVPL